MTSGVAFESSLSLGDQQAWLRLSADQYDQAVYTSPLLQPLLADELDMVRAVLEPTDVLLEVGCGTGQFCRRLVGAAHAVVGIDISSPMLDELRRHVGDQVLLIQGDAARLSALLAQSLLFRSITVGSPRLVVSCVMNTLGIMPEGMRRMVIRQMAITAGSAGRIFIVVFNAAYFGRGIEEFYRVNPGGCGPLDDACVDRAAAELTVPRTGYFTHWFAEEELREIAREAYLRNVRVVSRGIAFFLFADGHAPEQVRP